VYVNVDVAAGKPTRLPAELRERVSGYERLAPEQT
jgi:acyl-CoA thioesterase FadM